MYLTLLTYFLLTMVPLPFSRFAIFVLAFPGQVCYYNKADCPYTLMCEWVLHRPLGAGNTFGQPLTASVLVTPGRLLFLRVDCARIGHNIYL